LACESQWSDFTIDLNVKITCYCTRAVPTSLLKWHKIWWAEHKKQFVQSVTFQRQKWALWPPCTLWDPSLSLEWLKLGTGISGGD